MIHEPLIGHPDRPLGIGELIYGMRSMPQGKCECCKQKIKPKYQVWKLIVVVAKSGKNKGKAVLKWHEFVQDAMNWRGAYHAAQEMNKAIGLTGYCRPHQGALVYDKADVILETLATVGAT